MGFSSFSLLTSFFLRVRRIKQKVQECERILKLEENPFVFLVISLQHKLPVALMYFKRSHLFLWSEKRENILLFMISSVQQCEFDAYKVIFIFLKGF